MKYKDGGDLRIGDHVSLGGDMSGTIVAVIEDGVFSAEFPAFEWRYLESGFLVLSPEAGIIHYSQLTDDVRLLSRSHM